MNERDIDNTKDGATIRRLHNNPQLVLANWMNTSLNTCLESWAALKMDDPVWLLVTSAETNSTAAGYHGIDLTHLIP
jgi:hypothetical protein